MNDVCDTNIVVPAQDTTRIQEMHIVVSHTICHLIDLEFSEAK
jgi:D-sedoheptulose 7-phosphate isomerase